MESLKGYLAKLSLKRKLIIGGILLILITIVYFVLSSQFGAKKFGGTYHIELKENEKLSNITWKDDDLWILTRKAKNDEIAETYDFREDSKFNVLNGNVVIKEKITNEKK